MADPESTDLNDLLDQAEIVREDIESNIIAEITAELQEKDEIIKTLQNRITIAAVVFTSLWIVYMLFFIMKIIKRVVNSTSEQKLQNKLAENVEIVKVNPSQVVYTIEV